MQNDTPKYCPAIGKPYVVGKNNATKKAFVFIPGCGRWDCPVCREQNKADWVFIAMSGAVELEKTGKKLAFITVTARGGRGRSRERAIGDFAVGWPRLARRAKYHNGGEFEYFLIPELHQNGIVHYHLIATDQQSKRWWKDNAFKSGLGYMADRKELTDVAAVVFYAAKYIGKDLGISKWPDGLRRVRTSRGWPRPPEIERPPDWEYEIFRDKGAVFWEVHLLEDYGYTVTVSDEVKTT